MNTNKYNVLDIIRYALTVLKNKLSIILITLLVNILILTVLNYFIFENISGIIAENAFNIKGLSDALLNMDILLYAGLALLIESLFGSFLVQIISNYAMNENQSIISQILEALKKSWYYLGAKLTLYVIGIIGILIILIFEIMPLVSMIFLIVYIIFLVIFLAYFRFVPYTAFIKENYEEMFTKTKRYIDEHFYGSLAILVPLIVILFVINTVITLIAGTVNLTPSNDFIMILVLTILSTAVFYGVKIIDVVFIIFGVKKEIEIEKEITHE